MATDTPELQRMSNAAIKKARQSQSLSPELDEILSLLNARIRNLEDHVRTLKNAYRPPSGAV